VKRVDGASVSVKRLNLFCLLYVALGTLGIALAFHTAAAGLRHNRGPFTFPSGFAATEKDYQRTLARIKARREEYEECCLK
jgi:hypothetical protein